MRKAVGEFEGKWNDPARLDRCYFLAAAQEEVPALVTRLAATFTASSPGVELRGTGWMDDFVGLTGAMLAEDGAPFARLKSEVETWARQFHLTKSGEPAQWVLEAVAETFFRWARAGSPDDQLTPPGYSQTVPYIDKSLHVPAFSVTRWDPASGATREQVEAKIENEIRLLRRHFKAQLDRIEGEASTGGLVKAQTNFNAEHFQWAARFQCGKESVSALVRKLQGSDRSYRMAINSVLASVDLTRRIERSGRPRRQK